jgi:hypothetical protein
VKRLRSIGAPIPISLALAAAPVLATAQDPFEIEVYGYETAPRGVWELETHLNYIASGTSGFDGSVAPTEHQAHLSFELTRGLSDQWEVTAYLLSAYRPGPGVEYAGWRLRSRVRAPEQWGLPFDFSLAAELEFTQAAYDENSRGLELRPIVAKRLGRLEVDLNPVVERGLAGQNAASAAGWEFEPAGRVGLTLTKRVDLALEYYGKTALLGNAVRPDEQVHQFYPSVDVRFGEDLVLNAGIGFGTTSAGNRLVFKSRCEIPFGGEQR